MIYHSLLSLSERKNMFNPIRGKSDSLRYVPIFGIYRNELPNKFMQVQLRPRLVLECGVSSPSCASLTVGFR